MPVLIGVDGYRGGWVAAVLADDAIRWRIGPVGAIDRVVADASVAAIDIPIGLTDTGWRTCDVEAKNRLGRAGSRVFMTPPRDVIELGLAVPNEVVQEAARRLTGQGVSRQALGLAQRILDVDRLLPDARIIEVHPELSFLAMTGAALTPKKTAAGAAERTTALAGWRSDIADALAHRPDRVPIDDALDALAALWTAQRHATGASIAVPDDTVECDRRGVAMRIMI